MQSLNTVAELLDALGGDAKLADSFGITEEAVALWRVRACIPRGWHLVLDRMARARGFAVSDAVWGLEGFDPLKGFSASISETAVSA